MAKIIKMSDAVLLGLHTSVMLAANPGRSFNNREIAEELKVSEAHLSKVMQTLVKHALVSSTRGPKGGFVLQRPAEEISVLEVYEAIEGPLEVSDCLQGGHIWGGKSCILGDMVRDIGNRVKGYMKDTTLADVKDVYRCDKGEKKQRA